MEDLLLEVCGTWSNTNERHLKSPDFLIYELAGTDSGDFPLSLKSIKNEKAKLMIIIAVGKIVNKNRAASPG